MEYGLEPYAADFMNMIDERPKVTSPAFALYIIQTVNVRQLFADPAR